MRSAEWRNLAGGIVVLHRGIGTCVTRRLFLVAGSAGSGKSTLAKALAHELDAGWLQLDSIWLAMKVAAGEGTPAQDVLKIDCRMRREDEADDDVLAAHVAASGEVCRVLPTVLGLELEAHERLVVDGAWLLLLFVTELELPDTQVRAVYVVQRTEADVEAALIPRRGRLPLEDRHRLMNRRIFQYGAWIAEEARAHDLPVVEGAAVRVPAGPRPGCAASRTEKVRSLGWSMEHPFRPIRTRKSNSPAHHSSLAALRPQEVRDHPTQHYTLHGVRRSAENDQISIRPCAGPTRPDS